MLHFTALERAVLEDICQQQADQREVLQRQLATATVTGRKNTGTGFFTYLAVARDGPPLISRFRILGNVVATIAGFEAPLILTLFMKDGYANRLEATTSGDSTAGIDLTSLRFTINPS